MIKMCRVRDCNDDAGKDKVVGKLPVCDYHYSKMTEGHPLVFKASYQQAHKENKRAA